MSASNLFGNMPGRSDFCLCRPLSVIDRKTDSWVLPKCYCRRIDASRKEKASAHFALANQMVR